MEKTQAWSKRDFAQLIRNEGFTVEEAKDGPELYFPVKLEGLESLGEHASHIREFEKAVSSCRQYASGFIIRDPFGTEHDRRRSWRKGMDKKHPGFYRFYKTLNKLGGNDINGVTGHLAALVDLLKGLEIDSKQAKRIIQIEENLPHAQLERYESLQGEEKIAIARHIEEASREFLRVVTGVEV